MVQTPSWKSKDNSWLDGREECPQDPIEDKTKTTKDLYSELIKLDDLLKKGIITDKEFDARKKKILNEN